MSHQVADASLSADSVSHVESNGEALPPNWETSIPAIPVDQQYTLLAAAVKRISQRSRPASDINGERARSFFSPLLAGQSATLPPAPATPFQPVDCELDEGQLLAIAGALHSPDVYLIAGLPGTGKSRVLAELIRQATRQGQRVLFCSPTPAGLDAVLARLEGDGHALPLRYIGNDEKIESLSPISANFTFNSYSQRVLPEAISRAEKSIADLDATAARLSEADECMRLLSDLAESRRRIDMQLAELAAAQARLPTDIRQLAEKPDGQGDFVEAIKRRRQEFQLRLDHLAEFRRKAEAARVRTESDAGDLAGKLEGLQALQKARLLSIQHLKRVFTSGLPQRVTELQSRLQSARAAHDQEAAKCLSFDQEIQRIETEWRDVRDQLVEKEIARRKGETAAAIADRERERAGIDENWRAEAMALGADAPAPGADISAVREKLQQQATQSQADREQSRKWVHFLKQHGESLSHQALAGINVAVATPVGLADKNFTKISRDAPFDLLILDEAHRVGETEFMSLARRAGRWVLAGEPAVESRSRSKANAKSGFFARLWPMLHCDHWYSADGRVICQLRVLSAADRSRLETEPLADHPEVELHILMPDGGEPALAEVIFAPGLPIEQAKLLLYRELNELPIPSGSGVWEERPQRLVYRLASCPAPQTVELEPGLRELYRPAGRCWQTVGFEFEAGTWPRERAESWTKRHLQARDTGRTTRLIVPHRMRPALANFVSALCFECAYAHRQPPALPTSAVVEFYPVPALVNEGGPRRRGDHGDNGLPRRLPPLRGGAGQELDLADFRHRERLPTELRSRLPEAGYVNLPEAHAVVRLLESRVSGGWSSPLTVLSLHAAQAEVIRHFAKLSPILAKTTVSIQIEAAAAFGQRECETAIVSLTRSHGHRAVTYGDEPGLLPLALTRARQRLILIGDAGTLARRAAWDGPLDHYDAPTAAAETAWAANLIAQLRSQTLPVSIHLHEGPP